MKISVEITIACQSILIYMQPEAFAIVVMVGLEDWLIDQ